MTSPWPFPLRVLNKRLVQLQERVSRNRRVIGQPFALALEPGNACNLRCPLCATTFREPTLPRGVLTVDAARAILDRFPALVHLNLSMWGEPLLNPQLCDIISLARRRKIDVLVQSHFSLDGFDRTAAQRLLDSDLNRLQLSIDGATEEGYARYRRRGRLSTVLRNLDTLRSLQFAQSRKNPRITWKMIVHRYNEHEVATAKELAEAYGADFRVIAIYVPKGLEDKWQPVGSAWRNGSDIHRDNGERCNHLWQSLSVNFNGDVFPCCSEWSPADALGNVLRQPVAEIWNSPVYRSRRAKNHDGPPHCDECHGDKSTVFWRQWYLGEQNPAMDPDFNSAMQSPRDPTPPTTLAEDPAAPAEPVPVPRG